MTRTPILVASGVRKRFARSDPPVLDGISLAVDEGRALLVTGANGSGKTTLLACLAGLLPRDEGSVRIDGVQVESGEGAQFRTMGYVPDDYPVRLKLSILELLQTTAALHGLASGRSAAGLEAAARRFDVWEVRDVLLDACSHGMAKRALLAAAFLVPRRLLLLDEPDLGLDEQGRALLDAALREHLRSGGALVLASHHLAWARAIAHEELVLAAGRPVARETERA